MNKQLVAKYCNSNPPWADKAVRQNEARIARAFGKKALPEIVEGKAYSELGCGHYGCVYSTGLNKKVLKITSDPSEVQLVKFLLKHKDEQERYSGLVKYYKVLDLKTSHRGRSVYAILREEAYEVGYMIDTYDQLVRRESKKINGFLWFASQARDMYLAHGSKPYFDEKVEAAFYKWNELVAFHSSSEFSIGSRRYNYVSVTYDWSIPKWIKSTDRAGFALVGCKTVVEVMSQSPEVIDIGQTLAWFLCYGKLLADVHLNNIGKVIREDNSNEPMPAITDPGHAVDVMPIHTYICD